MPLKIKFQSTLYHYWTSSWVLDDLIFAITGIPYFLYGSLTADVSIVIRHKKESVQYVTETENVAFAKN